MTAEELKQVNINDNVFDLNSKKLVKVVSTIGFTKNNKVYIPCTNEHDYVDDYCIDNLIIDFKETENIYLNRLKEQYIEVNRNFLPLENQYRRTRYGAMRDFCLDTQLISFNDIELMELEINNKL